MYIRVRSYLQDSALATIRVRRSEPAGGEIPGGAPSWRDRFRLSGTTAAARASRRSRAGRSPTQRAGLFHSKRCPNTLTVHVVLPSASAGSWACPFFSVSPVLHYRYSKYRCSLRPAYLADGLFPLRSEEHT